MATTISAFNNFRIDTLDPHTMGDTRPVGMPVVTPDKVTWQTSLGTFELFGANFSVNYSTMALTGTAHTVTYSEGGVVLAKAEGMNLEAGQVQKISLSPQTVDALIEVLIPGDNIFRLGGANDVIDVGAGHDVVYGATGRDLAIIDIGWLSPGRASYLIERQIDGSISITNSRDLIELHDVERVQFSDGIVAFDIDGVAGQAYRLYQAAFDRTPDISGLSFWVDSLDAGTQLNAVAASFIASNEFNATYGSLSDAQFVDQLYKNVLDRSADSTGLQFWVEQLESGAMDRARVLVGFSESAENVDLVGPAINDGIWLGL
jgi:Ca2+-binding RTX toxin-like protein